MCYSNASTSKNVDLSKRYKKAVPQGLDERPVFFASGFTFPQWRVITAKEDIQVMHWGLIPSWFSDSNPKDMASKTLNARVETLDEKASFRNLVARNRCIIPSTGFFEWQTNGSRKTPFFIHPPENELFSMAGLFDQWMNPLDGQVRSTFTIITCPANALMEEIHNTKKRMPLMLDVSQEKEWLHGTLAPSSISTVLTDSLLMAHEVEQRIISGKYPNCAEVQLPFHNPYFEQGSLF
jgi:putative SOS response-associated peptidase YedK